MDQPVPTADQQNQLNESGCDNQTKDHEFSDAQLDNNVDILPHPATIEASWEQTSKDVHVSLEIGDEVKDIDIDLLTSSTGLLIKLKDGREWRCELHGEIINEDTKYVFGKEKINIAMIKKEGGLEWSELGKVKTCYNAPQSTEQKSGIVAPHGSPERKSDETPDIENPETTENQRWKLDHVKDDFYDKEKFIHYILYLQKTKDVEVDFFEKSFTYSFKSRDQRFLELYRPSTEDTVFFKEIKTKHPYNSEKSTYKVTPNKIEISLAKYDTSIKWTCVEAPSHTQSKTTSLVEDKPSSCGDFKQPHVVDSRPTFSRQHGTTDKQTPLSEKEKKEMENRRAKPTSMYPYSAKSYYARMGLENLGNTCFMNSMLQCLVNTTSLKEFMLSRKFLKDLNRHNPLGCEGKLASQFAVLNERAWGGNYASFAPSNLKYLVSLKASQFTGFHQHDAQEFLAFLLDGLHEDLNRVQGKPYIELSNLDHLPDKEHADTRWKQYRARNDSFIVDNFQGQYRSELVCPTCEKVSITFDPYMHLSVPLPKKKIVLTVFLFRSDTKQIPRKYLVSITKDGKLSELKTELSNLCGIAPSKMIVLEVYRRQIQKVYDRNSLFSSQTVHDIIFVFEKISSANSDDPLVRLRVYQRVQETTALPTQCSNCQKPAASLKRCTSCYKVGYCDDQCQRDHWKTHQKPCKATEKLEFVGQPFIVSMPRSQLSYQSIAEKMEAYAQYSVNTFCRPIVKSKGDNEDLEPDQHTNTPISPSTPTPSGSNRKFYFTIRRASQPSVIITDKVDVSSLENGCELCMDWLNDERSGAGGGFVYVGNVENDLKYEDDPSCLTVQARMNTNEWTLSNCIRLFTEPEKLAAEESWYCPSCKDHVQATKQMSLWTVPPTLIFQLKRFSFKNHMWREKIDQFIDYPLDGLDMTPFTSEALSPDEPPPIYDLYGVVNHHGGLLGGHYTSYVRCLNDDNTCSTKHDWRLMDDRWCRYEEDTSRVISRAAYVLFYKRREFVSPDTVPSFISEKLPTDSVQDPLPFDPPLSARPPSPDSDADSVGSSGFATAPESVPLLPDGPSIHSFWKSDSQHPVESDNDSNQAEPASPCGSLSEGELSDTIVGEDGEYECGAGDGYTQIPESPECAGHREDVEGVEERVADDASPHSDFSYGSLGDSMLKDEGREKITSSDADADSSSGEEVERIPGRTPSPDPPTYTDIDGLD